MDSRRHLFIKTTCTVLGVIVAAVCYINVFDPDLARWFRFVSLLATGSPVFLDDTGLFLLSIFASYLAALITALPLALLLNNVLPPSFLESREDYGKSK